ncbi:hypothetical protein SVIOM342S_01119 [Streptomyces violaceorubidus]
MVPDRPATAIAHFRPDRFQPLLAEAAVTVASPPRLGQRTERHVPVPRVRERRVHLVGDHRDPELRRQREYFAQFVTGQDPPGGVVRVAQEIRGGPGPEGPGQPLQIEPPATQSRRPPRSRIGRGTTWRPAAAMASK